MNKKIIYTILSFVSTLPQLPKAQNVGIGTNTPVNSALLDMSSTS